MRSLEKVNILLQFCVNMIGWIDKKWSLDHRKHVLDQVLLNVIEEAVLSFSFSCEAANADV